MLELSLLGEISIRLDGEPIARFRSQKQIALLSYLAHTGQTHNREALADLLWETTSTKQALSNLRTTLTRLRKKIGPNLIVTQKTVSLTAAVHEQTDSVRFQTMLAAAGPSDGAEPSIAAVNLLAQGLELYSGEFMAGFSLPSPPRFNDWLIVEQERVRQIAMRGYRLLAAWQEQQGAFSAGVITAQRWVSWDHLDETAQQQLMRLLAYDGRVSEALGVYEKCRHLLLSELDIPPAPATTALYASIQESSLPTIEITPLPLHNLPRALTPLFGRKNEIQQLTDYLRNPDYPLITITGAGGIGKTSLALAAGRHLQTGQHHPFKDGIWFVSLEVIENDTPDIIRDEVAVLVAQAMGLYFHSESDLWSQLLGQLASKKLLLILDNIGQFLTIACDLIVELLAAGANIHLLVTSLTTLPLASSVSFPLKGLETPEDVSADALRNSSVLLFAERASRMPAPFDVEQHLAQVVAVCQFMDGMPLGIELAAASLGRLMVDEIMPAMTTNLRLLNTTRRDLPARQRTLHAVFDYSWQLLDAREQSLLAQISIFRGGFTRQAAAAVINGPTSGLYDLIDHALLNRNQVGRFRMHPLLRQLAREKLSSPDMIESAGQVLDRHTLYFARFLQQFEDDLRRGVGKKALQTILPEQANLRAAWQHAVHAGLWQTIDDCLESAHCFYQRKGLFTEEATLVDSAIVALQSSLEVDADLFMTSLLSRLLTVRAQGYQHSAQFEKGVETAVLAYELARKVGQPQIEAGARLAWARILSMQHKRERALAQYKHVVALAEIAHDQILEADGWMGIGVQNTWLADLDSAQKPLHHALQLCQTLQYTPGEMETLILLGNLAGRQEAAAESIDYYQQALELSRLLGDVPSEAEVLGSIGVRSSSQAEFVDAQSYLREALATFRRLHMPESEQWILGELGYTNVQLGDYDTAVKHLNAALTIARHLNDEFWQAWLKLRSGTIWNERDEPDKALPLIMEAFETSEQFQYINFQAAVLYDWGNVWLSLDDWANAELKFQKAYEMRHGSGRTEQALPALAGLAYATYRAQKPAIAAAHAEQLWQSWQDSPAWAERANLKLFWMLGTVWDGLGDNRAKDLWQKAHILLQTRCAKIPTENAQKLYLNQVPSHQAILQVGQSEGW